MRTLAVNNIQVPATEGLLEEAGANRSSLTRVVEAVEEDYGRGVGGAFELNDGWVGVGHACGTTKKYL